MPATKNLLYDTAQRWARAAKESALLLNEQAQLIEQRNGLLAEKTSLATDIVRLGRRFVDRVSRVR